MDRDELYTYFITENHSRIETAEHFNLTEAQIKRQLRLHNIKKDHVLAAKNSDTGKAIRNKKKFTKDGVVKYFIPGEEEKGYFLVKESIISKDDLYTDFIINNMSRLEVAAKYNTTDGYVKRLLKEYDIKKDKSSSVKLRNKTVNAQNRFEESIKRVPKEDLLKYYIDENHSRKDCCKHFNVTMNNLKLIISIYEIPNKERDLVQTAIEEANMEKFGVPYGFLNANSSHGQDSKPNLLFKQLLEENDIAFEREFSIGSFIYDFKVGTTLVEINPTATHNSTWNPFTEPVAPTYHYTKTYYAIDNGYRVINVWDWDNMDAIIEMLKQKENIYARKCEVRDVSVEEAKAFINRHHAQSYARDSIRLGLYYKDELVSLMTFDKPRYNKKFDYELVRYCASKNVTGGAEKLFNYFTKMYPGTVISYCDNSKFNGNTYIKLGFTKMTKGTPAIHWYNIKSKKHITDNLLRQRGYDQLFGTSYGKGMDNAELMLANGFVKVYDCGQSTFVYL